MASLFPHRPSREWRLVNIFHRRIAGLDRLLEDNKQAQRRMPNEQDGSEVKSAELERLTALGISIIEHRDAFEAFREIGASCFESQTCPPGGRAAAQ